MKPVREKSDQTLPVTITLLMLFIALLWGGHTVAVKVAFDGFPPMATAGIRFSIAMITIAAYALIRGIRLFPRSGEVLPLLLIGVVFVCQIVTFTLGVYYTRAGRASVLINTYPLFVALLAHFLTSDDRLTGMKAVGLICAFGGVFSVFWENFSGGGGLWLGDSLMVASGFFLALLVVLTKKLVQNVDAARVLFSEMMVGVPVFFLLSFLMERGRDWQITLPVAAGLLYQGAVVGGFCFLTWISVLKYYPSTKLSVLFFTTPLWGILLSRLTLGEPLTPWLGLGAAIVALGIIITNRFPESGRKKT